MKHPYSFDPTHGYETPLVPAYRNRSAGHFEYPELPAEMAALNQRTESVFWPEAPLWK